MYQKYWGLSGSPFQNVSAANTYFPSPIHEEARGRIFYAISYDKGGALFTGEVGMGKTTVCKVILNRLLDKHIDIGLITNPALDVNDLLREILYQFEVNPPSTNKLDLIRKINDMLIANFRKGIKTVLIIDEAHLIRDDRVLEELRLLLNLQGNDSFLLTLILVGQPELRKIIRNIPPLEQRLTVKFHMKHFSSDDTRNYIFYRLKQAGAKESIFTPDAIKVIHNHSKGVPRKINQMCDLALLVGFSGKKYFVDANIVKKVIADETKHGV